MLREVLKNISEQPLVLALDIPATAKDNGQITTKYWGPNKISTLFKFPRIAPQTPRLFGDDWLSVIVGSWICAAARTAATREPRGSPLQLHTPITSNTIGKRLMSSSSAQYMWHLSANKNLYLIIFPIKLSI
jgi:hypothetical protein